MATIHTLSNDCSLDWIINTNKHQQETSITYVNHYDFIRLITNEFFFFLGYPCVCLFPMFSFFLYIYAIEKVMVNKLPYCD